MDTFPLVPAIIFQLSFSLGAGIKFLFNPFETFITHKPSHTCPPEASASKYSVIFNRGLFVWTCDASSSFPIATQKSPWQPVIWHFLLAVSCVRSRSKLRCRKPAHSWVTWVWLTEGSVGFWVLAASAQNKMSSKAF